MALDAKDYGPGKAIYTFVDHEGKNTHIDSELLRQWCAQHREELDRQGRLVLTPVNPIIAVSFLEENVIDLKHAREVANMRTLDPIIYCESGTFTEGRPDCLLADGHHRYFVAFILGSQLIPAYVLSQEQWREFEILGMPQVTKELLMAMPTKAQHECLKAAGITPVILEREEKKDA